MAEYRTKSCYGFAHKEFSFRLDDRLGFDPAWLISFELSFYDPTIL